MDASQRTYPLRQGDCVARGVSASGVVVSRCPQLTSRVPLSPEGNRRTIQSLWTILRGFVSCPQTLGAERDERSLPSVRRRVQVSTRHEDERKLPLVRFQIHGTTQQSSESVLSRSLAHSIWCCCSGPVTSPSAHCLARNVRQSEYGRLSFQEDGRRGHHKNLGMLRVQELRKSRVLHINGNPPTAVSCSVPSYRPKSCTLADGLRPSFDLDSTDSERSNGGIRNCGCGEDSSPSLHRRTRNRIGTASRRVGECGQPCAEQPNARNAVPISRVISLRGIVSSWAN